MRIAIDARKLRDYGIGTYVRNLLRQLARQDTDQRLRRVLPRAGLRHDRRVRPAVPRGGRERPGRIRSRNSSRSRWTCGAKAVELFHAPHYVLPPLTPCRSVVTIHDCIHLRFPQYLPSKLGYAYARGQMWAATHQAARVHHGLGSVEARHPALLPRAGVEDRRHLQRHRRSLLAGARRRRDQRVRERYRLTDPFVLYAGNIKPHKNLERLIEAFHLMRHDSPDLANVQLLIIGDEISKYATLRRAVHRHKLHKHVRFFGFVSGPDARGALPARRRLRVPVALRRVRAAAARGDGQRHAGHHVERLVAARGRRRRGAA